MDINSIGRLEYNEDAEFELHMDNGEIINISKILDDIYSPTSLKDSQVYISVMKGEVILFNEDGALVKKKDEHGIISYHVCGENLDLCLFKNTEKILEIIVKKKGKCLKYGKVS